MVTHPQILITNDDGIDSPGIAALENALSLLGDVTVVAPDREMSATSHRITLDRRLDVRQIGPNRYAVEDGTPADCVIAAFMDILTVKPSIVFSGVNRGHNVGDDVSYSGTVAAASEAVLQGIPAVAVSTFGCAEPAFEAAANIAAGIARRVMEHGLPPDVILNVNYPQSWNGILRLTRQGRHEKGQGRNGQSPIITPTATEPAMTDLAAVAAGFVSVSPLHLDRTAHAHFPRFAHWFTDPKTK